MAYLLIVLATFSATLAAAAPHPVTSSSEIVTRHLSSFVSSHGFRIDASGTDWVQAEPPKTNKYIVSLFQAPVRQGKLQPSLTVRVDELKDAMTLPNYVHKWLKEYPKFGFDVLGSKPFTQDGISGQVVDILNHEGYRQLRQVVFLKNKTAVILTCRDEREHFRPTLKACNQIIRSFRWIQ